jgi:hypothetical protein
MVGEVTAAIAERGLPSLARAPAWAGRHDRCSSVRMRYPLAVLALIGLTSCAGAKSDLAPALSTTAATVGTHTAANPAASFEHYRTFSFGAPEGPPAGYAVSPRSAEVQRRARPIIQSMLAERGYTPVPAKGDLTIMFGSGRRESSTHETSSVGEAWLPDDENQDFVEGALVIDAFDGAGGEKVWHGAMQANIDPDKLDDAQLQRSVQRLITAFPAADATVRVQ